MAAIYPTALKSFIYKQDFTQIVDAGDVNVAYDEIGAIENILGTTPNSDTIDGKVVTWPTVKANISALRQGTSIIYCGARAVNIQVPYNTLVNPVWNSNSGDTHGMLTGGSTITCIRSGFWLFHTNVRWFPNNFSNDSQQTPFNRSGMLRANVRTTGEGFPDFGQTDAYPQGWQVATTTSNGNHGHWVQGSGIAVELTQTVSTTPLVVTVDFELSFLRVLPTTNNM